MTTDIQQGGTDIVQALQKAGFEAYFAGGCVRDHLMDRPCKDIDIATNAQPEDILDLFPRSQSVGKAFGVIIVSHQNTNYDVATFREDHDYQDGRHPSSISFTNVEGDAARRDFTINAMYWDPVNDALLDFHNGQADLEQKLIRCVGDAAERFGEDYLRMMRAVRFASILGFNIEQNTLNAIQDNAKELSNISGERIREEFTRSWDESIKKERTLDLYIESGIFNAFFPDLTTPLLRNKTQASKTLSELQLNDTAGCLASILNAAYSDAQMDESHYAKLVNRHSEELLSINLTKQTMKRLNALLSVQDRLFNTQPLSLSETRFIAADTDAFDGLKLHDAICLAYGNKPQHLASIENMLASLGEEPVLPKPWLNGNDLMEMGIPKGPQLGQASREAYVHQLNRDVADKNEIKTLITEKFKLAL